LYESTFSSQYCLSAQSWCVFMPWFTFFFSIYCLSLVSDFNNL